MKIFTTKKELHKHVSALKATQKSIGFVATMGALHQGHISLIERAALDNDIVVCSIFVNPSQFNDPKDLEKYPRTIEADVALLTQAKCNILFNPPVSEIYDGNEQWHLDIGETEHLLEGEFRPGHYQGVTQVVNKLFNIVEPDTAYFGQKDYQQFLVISVMVSLLNMPVKLIMCPIKREADGLAMSSRNIHLTAAERRHALVLSRTLNLVKNEFTRENFAKLIKEAASKISAEPDVELDYFEIADGETLKPATQNSKTIVALVAAKVGKTRLIDNIILV